MIAWGTIAANLALLAILFRYRRWLPLCFGCQAMVIVLTAVMAYAYYSPSVDPLSYRNAWQATDGICLLCAAGIGWELIERTRCIALGGAWLLYAGWCLWEYLPDCFLGPHTSRQVTNLILTMLTVIALAGKGDYDHQEAY